jgi:hypothetical protein
MNKKLAGLLVSGLAAICLLVAPGALHAAAPSAGCRLRTGSGTCPPTRIARWHTSSTGRTRTESGRTSGTC